MDGSRFFRSVKGHAVARYGHADLLVGAERDATAEGGIRWSEDPVEIAAAELAAYPREYARAIRDGSLVELKGPGLDALLKARGDEAAKAAKAKARETPAQDAKE